jgi:hypothetical protein
MELNPMPKQRIRSGLAGEPRMDWTPSFVKQLKRDQADAQTRHLEQFDFCGRPMLTRFAFYLLQHIEQALVLPDKPKKVKH